MGKKLDALLGRSFKTSKFKATVAMAVSRLAVLRNQRHARCSIARSDVVELLKNNSRDRALLRVEQVIKEQNMLDVFDLTEGYFHLLMERVHLFEKEKECPEELKEAVSTLIFVATRCGDFPELQQIRSIFVSRFGREFVDRAIELRNNCGVNPKIIQKLSTRMPSLENKMKVLKEIALETNIDLPIEETSKMESKEESLIGETQAMGPLEVPLQEEKSSAIDLGPRRMKYRDVADAAQAAFESAAYAAAAARAAVELSRSDPHRTTQLLSLDQHETSKILQRSGDEGSDSDENVGLEGDGEIKQRGIVFDDDGDGEEGFRGVEAKSYNVQFSGEKRESTEALGINRRPISVRTRRPH